MDLAKALLKKIVYLIPAIIILALLFIAMRALYVSFGLSNKLGEQTKSFKNTDFLPPPGSLGIAGGKAPTPTDTPTVPTYKQMEQMYSAENKYQDTRARPSVYDEEQGSYTYRYNTTLYTDANPEVRTITIVKNNLIVSGVILTGTAQSSFMKKGKFLISLENRDGDVVMSTIAYAQANPQNNMFIPWKAQVGYVPNNSAPCTLVLENENYSGEPALSKIIRLPVTCK